MTDSGGENMLVRRAAPEDLDAIMAIYDSGRAFMRAQGNYVQWVNGYPSRDLLAEDIRKGQCYVCEAEGEIAGVFAFILGEDPTYQKIEEGSWRSASPYGTVHRLASSGKYRGVGKTCYDFCKCRIGHVRADTHEDNRAMRRSLERNGFQRRGVIHIADGTPRIAYEFLAEDGEG